MSNPIDEALEKTAGAGEDAKNVAHGLGSFADGVRDFFGSAPVSAAQSFAKSVAEGGPKNTNVINARTIGRVATPLALGAAAVGVGVAVNHVVAAAKKRDAYRGMMDLNPDLKELQAEDPRRFQAYYDSLHKLSPTFAADPVISGTLMRRMVAARENAGNVLTSLVRPPEAPSRGKGPLAVDVGFGPFKLRKDL